MGFVWHFSVGHIPLVMGSGTCSEIEVKLLGNDGRLCYPALRPFRALATYLFA